MWQMAMACAMTRTMPSVITCIEGLYLYKCTRTTQCVVRAIYFRRERAKLDFSILLLMPYIQSYSQLEYLWMKTSYS